MDRADGYGKYVKLDAVYEGEFFDDKQHGVITEDILYLSMELKSGMRGASMRVNIMKASNKVKANLYGLMALSIELFKYFN